MSRVNPVYTLHNECQDCYRCVRSCPVKAIRILNGHAQVLPSRCISCAACVGACPSHAKQVRSDLEQVRKLVMEHDNVYVSLGPTWRGPFDISEKRMAALLRRLGFRGVSETALGAQQTALEYARIINQAGPGLYISSQCPVIVDYIRLYKPKYVGSLLPAASPVLTHAKYLKEKLGGGIHVVFIGACVAAKNEADRCPELLDAAITFSELKQWIDQSGVKIPGDEEVSAEDTFVPEKACEGVLYALSGGVRSIMERAGISREVQMMSLSPLQLIARGLDFLNVSELRHPVFVEALACAGGCVGGPEIATRRSIFSITSEIMDRAPHRDVMPKTPEVVLPVRYKANPVQRTVWTPQQIMEALKRIGKYAPEDELNCMACGYHTCREMAAALLDGNAEPSMCASYMRTLAARRAAAVLKGMPSAVVMVDRNMKIIEANESFVQNFLPSAAGTSKQPRDILAGKPVATVLDWTDLFKTVLKSNKEQYLDHYAYRGKYYEVRVFPLEQGESVGAIIYDVANTRNNQERVAQKAREVIRRNIATVQEIARLLGEHVVETESLLNSIASEAENSNPDTGTDETK